MHRQSLACPQGPIDGPLTWQVPTPAPNAFGQGQQAGPSRSKRWRSRIPRAGQEGFVARPEALDRQPGHQDRQGARSASPGQAEAEDRSIACCQGPALMPGSTAARSTAE